VQPCIDGKIRANMWSFTRAWALLPLVLIACKASEVGPGSCPTGTAQVDGVCRATCTADGECLVSEFCDPAPKVCLPEPLTDAAKVKVFEVDPVPVARGGRVTIDFAVVSADRIRIDVLWEDGSTQALLDSGSEYFGTKVLEGVGLNGTAQLVATRNGVDIVRTRAIELDDGMPRIDEFKTEPGRVNAGESVTISWKVSNSADPIDISIEGGAVLVAGAAAEGSIDQPVFERTTFLLTSGALSARATVEVNAVGVEPQILSFDLLGPAPALHDYPVGIVWSTANAVEVRLIVDQQPAFTTRWPADVDFGGVPAILPPGYHQLRLEASGNGKTVSSPEHTVLFVSNQPPEIVRFDYPTFAFGNGQDLTVSWSIFPYDRDLTFAFFGWLDRAFSPVNLEDQASRTPPGYSVTAVLLAESPAGIAEMRASTFALAGEVEPNDEQSSAVEMNGYAIEATTSALDMDYYSAGFLLPDQTVIATLYGDCPLGLALTMAEENGPGLTYVSAFDGDCPRLSYTARAQLRAFLSVWHSVADVSAAVPYTISAEVRDPICGDGNVSAAEQCDLGDRINGDGCSANCENEELVHYELIDSGPIALEPRPPDARAIDFHAYPNGGGIPAEHGFGTLPLPAGFTFFERTYYALLVHADGFVSFVPDFLGAFEPQRPLEVGPPNELIALFGGDLRPTVGGGVYAWATGGGGIAIEYESFVLVGNPASRLTGRILLEPDGRIRLAYLSLENIGTGDLLDAGLQDRRGQRPVKLPVEELDGRFYELQGR
jgi:cysteine-rich repeat protein